jgi:hypothetical protein
MIQCPNCPREFTSVKAVSAHRKIHRSGYVAWQTRAGRSSDAEKLKRLTEAVREYVLAERRYHEHLGVEGLHCENHVARLVGLPAIK